MLEGIKLDRDGTRGYQIKRVIAIMIKISQRPVTCDELMRQFKVSKKTILRDIKVIEAVGVPVRFDKEYFDDAETEKKATVLQNKYSIDRHWMRRFL